MLSEFLLKGLLKKILNFFDAAQAEYATGKQFAFADMDAADNFLNVQQRYRADAELVQPHADQHRNPI